MEAAVDLLEKYKRHPFAKGLLPFRPTLRSLEVPYPKIYAKQDGRQRWVICDKTTGEPALFSHAGAIAQTDHIETGNYVPPREVIPPGVEVKNVQRRANSKCFYTYVLDSFSDVSMYEGQWILDDYMRTVNGFNPTDVPRRAYLSGQEEKYRTRFWMQTPMFLRMGPNEEQPAGPRHLHPWVLQAHRESKVFRANPDRPRVWVKDGGSIVPISERVPDSVQRGDIVALSFTITYHITNSNWFPQFHPADVVVLKRSEGDPTDYNAPEINLYNRPPPAFVGCDGEDDGNVASASRTASGEGVHSRAVEVVTGAASTGAGRGGGQPMGEDPAGEGQPGVEEAVGGEELRAKDGVVGGSLSALDAVVEEQEDGKETKEVDGRTQESMKVDDTGGLQRERSSDTLHSGDESQGQVAGDFELVTGEGHKGEKMFEDFVDVATQEGGGRANRGSNGKSGRPSRKRP